MNQNTLDQTLDQALVLGPITTSGTAGASQIIDLGTGLVNFDVVYRISTCVLTTDESYQILIYGGPTAAAVTDNILSLSTYGKGSSFGSSVNKPVGTYIESCNNTTTLGTHTTMESQVVTYARYIGMAVVSAGLAPSIVFQANVVISK
jgi:hypothetical protein